MDDAILREIWRAANASSGRQIAYAALSREHAGATNKKALDLLAKARLVKVSRAATSAAIPFDLDAAPRIKPFAGDVGLYQTMAGRPADEALRERDLLAVYNGALAEQFVAQELAASFGGDEPHWWKRDAKNAQAEVDFMVALGGWALPIEVKSGAAHIRDRRNSRSAERRSNARFRRSLRGNSMRWRRRAKTDRSPFLSRATPRRMTSSTRG